MLTFCIPTWNRAEKLRLCLESIGEAIKGHPVDICVYNNASTDHTEDVLSELSQKYPIRFISGIEHLPFHYSYANATAMSGREWTWTFGDDDLLLDFDSVLPLLKSDAEFIHVAEKTRSTGSKRMYPETLLGLCCAVGWIEMTGFISGNIFKTDKMRAALHGDSLEVYGESAFPQSLAALAAFSDSKALFVDMPIIGLQDEQQTQETLERWNANGTVMRYSAVADGLELLRKTNVIPSVLPDVFFRYLSGSFIAKCMHAYWLETINLSNKLDDKTWNRLYLLAAYLDGNMLDIVRSFRTQLNDYCEFCEKGLALIKGMEKSCEDATQFSYPQTYI